MHQPNTHNFHVINPLKAELNPICYLLALLGAHHFLHVSRIWVNAQEAKMIRNFKNAKQKLLKTKTAIWFKKIYKNVSYIWLLQQTEYIWLNV